MIPIGWKIAVAVAFAAAISVECVVDAAMDALFEIELAWVAP